MLNPNAALTTLTHVTQTMHSHPLQLLADFSPGQLSGLLIPVAAIIVGGIIAISGMYFHHRRKELWHQTARVALEKGQPLPPMDRHEDEEPEPARAEREMAQHDVRGGMVLIAVGIGLWMMLSAIHPPLRFVGAIPGCIGIALLLFAIGRALFGRKPEKRDDFPGRS